MFHKSLLLTAVALAPNLSAIPVTTNTNTIQQPVEIEDEIQEERESCTVMYVGKNVSTTGKAYCCRCGDSSPRGLNINATIFEHNQLANVTTQGKNGFSWKFPSTTYRYISTPRNVLVRNGLHWEVSAINEMGVAASATLSCGANDAALEADPLVKTGISEDNLAQIMGATATSAKQAMQTIAKIIDEQGNADCNIIMAIDKDEAWLMEMYTGHQYAAIKLPDDKACSIGNEFFLNTLKDYDDVITSPNLFTLPKEKGFAKYDGEEKDENMHMYNTYAGEHTAGTFIDSCHMRTWIGRKLFCNEPGKYVPTQKYEPFFVPNKMPNLKLSVNDIITFFRDRFESILNDSSDPDYEYFNDHKDSLRPVGVPATYQVHIMSVNPNLPKAIAAEETIALSSANYTPFIPLNAGVNSMNSYYTNVSKNFGYDPNSAYSIFKRLNGLADTSRVAFGLPIQSYLANHEVIWQEHYEQLLKQIKDEKLDVQRNVLTNYCTSLQEAALAMSGELFNDLMWHIINQPTPSETMFQPFASLEYYAYLYGWDYKKVGDIATLTCGKDTVTVDYSYTEKPPKGWVLGKISKNGSDPEDVRVTIKQDVPCINYEMANKYIASGHDLVPIVWQDYNTYQNTNWVLPVCIIVPILGAAAMITPIIVTSVKKKKAIPQTSK